LCVDDFGVKYYSKADGQHLLDSLSENYTHTVDWQGQNFCGLRIEWNYEENYVDISMPNYIKEVLHRFNHPSPTSPQYSPHEHTPIQYGNKKRQYALEPDTSPLLDEKGIKFVQQVTGSLLYYARAIDGTMLPALNTIGTQQAKPTKKTMQKCLRLLDYAATYPNGSLRYHASAMLLHVDSDAAYLVLPNARSRIAGYYYLSGENSTSNNLNGPILIECKTIRNVVASAAEAEIGGLFHNAQISIPIRVLLTALGHPQPPTPIKTDNATAHGFIYDNINLKKSKSWDMKYFWLRDRKEQRQFKFTWDYGDQNEGDYFTKHHATIYHRDMRPRYIHDVVQHLCNKVTSICNKYNTEIKSSQVRGCVDP